MFVVVFVVCGFCCLGYWMCISCCVSVDVVVWSVEFVVRDLGSCVCIVCFGDSWEIWVF